MADKGRNEAGQFTLGHKKEGGKQKGQRVRTNEMVHRIFDICEHDFYDEENDRSQFCEDMNAMKPAERRQVMMQLLKTIMPAMSSISIEDNATVSSLRELMSRMAGYNKTKNN